MRYLLLIYNNEQEYDAKPEAERQTDYANYYAYDNEISASGAKLGGEPLLPTSSATTVRIRDGKKMTMHGPFAETKEQLGGFYLIQAENLDQAMIWAYKLPTASYGSIEIRPIMEMMGGA